LLKRFFAPGNAPAIGSDRSLLAVKPCRGARVEKQEFFCTRLEGASSTARASRGSSGRLPREPST